MKRLLVVVSLMGIVAMATVISLSMAGGGGQAKDGKVTASKEAGSSCAASCARSASQTGVAKLQAESGANLRTSLSGDRTTSKFTASAKSAWCKIGREFEAAMAAGEACVGKEDGDASPAALMLGASGVDRSCSAQKDVVIAQEPGEALTGSFDPGMSSVCQGACAVQSYDEADLVHQPGAKPGQLTQCPVSGVVFTVRNGNAGLDYEGIRYHTCCSACAGILAGNPEHFLKS